MVVRDQFSSYTTAKFVTDETHTTLQEAMIELLTPIRSTNPITIRTDNATAFQHIANNKSKEFKDLQMTLELGQIYNKKCSSNSGQGNTRTRR